MPRRYTRREVGNFRARQATRDLAAKEWFMSYSAACNIARAQIENCDGDLDKAAHATMKILNDAYNNRVMAPRRNRLVFSVLRECIGDLKQRDDAREAERAALADRLATRANVHLASHRHSGIVLVDDGVYDGLLANGRQPNPPAVTRSNLFDTSPIRLEGRFSVSRGLSFSDMIAELDAPAPSDIDFSLAVDDPQPAQPQEEQ
jgi:hypothetical protein